LAVLKDFSSLAKMFADQCEVSGINRAACGIPDWFPTNPQAEVLAFSGVPLSYVTEIHFQSQGGRSKFLLPYSVPLHVRVKLTYFDARDDWQVWKPVTEASSGESWQDAPSSVPF
jgi:hypothetical protein